MDLLGLLGFFLGLIIRSESVSILVVESHIGAGESTGPLPGVLGPWLPR